MGKKEVVLFIVIFFGAFFAVNYSWAWYPKSVEPSIEKSGTFLIELTDRRIMTKKVIPILVLTPEFRNGFLNWFGVKDPYQLIGLDRDKVGKPPTELIREIDRLFEELIRIDEAIRKKMYIEEMA